MSQSADTMLVADESELRRDCRTHPLGAAMGRLCGSASMRRRFFLRIQKLEGGPYRTATLRRVMRDHLGVRVGAYAYGPCLRPGAWPAGVSVGRYASIADGVKVFRRNHPLERLSLHPYFYNKNLGYVSEDQIESAPLEIGPDAWIGANVIVTAGCARIGVGAVVGAGAVVTRDVPDFAVAVGNPAKVIKHRFPEEVREAVLESRWWESPIETLARSMPEMLRDMSDYAPSSHAIAQLGAAS